MQNRSLGLVVAALAVVAAVALFFVLRDDDDEGSTEPTTQATATTTTEQATTTTEQTTTKEQTTTEEPQVATIEVKDGEPVGGVQELEFEQGEEMRFNVESNVEDEVHLHGYNITEDVAPGRPAKFVLEATEPGLFELELHHAVTQIGEISVQ